MAKVLKKIWSILSTVLVVLIVGIVILLVGVRLVGLQPYAVLSGSMEPDYPVGSLLYVKKVDPNHLEVGDDITFMLDEDTLATHRIIEVVPDEEEAQIIRFKTKGIANEYADSGLVHCNNVVGKPLFAIPYLGYVSTYIQNPPGLYITIAFVAILLLLVFLPDVLKDSGKKNKDSEEASGLIQR